MQQQQMHAPQTCVLNLALSRVRRKGEIFYVILANNKFLVSVNVNKSNKIIFTPWKIKQQHAERKKKEEKKEKEEKCIRDQKQEYIWYFFN